MLFGIDKSGFFGDTAIPDVFITEYLPSLTPTQVKLYVYAYYLSQRGLRIEKKDICAKLGMESQELTENLLEMEALGMLETKGKMIKLADLKEKQLLKFYNPKIMNDPEQVVENNEKNKKRLELGNSINNKFFQGTMSPTWYLDIDMWLERYGFEENVLYMLFQYCYDRKKFNRNYIAKVAEGWFKEGIKTCEDVDAYFVAYENRKRIGKKIASKMKIYSALTEYEEEYVKTWTEVYKFGFDVIELALKKTTKGKNVGFEYINKPLKEWFERGLSTPEEILEYEKVKGEKRTAKASGAMEESAAAKDVNWDSLYEN